MSCDVFLKGVIKASTQNWQSTMLSTYLPTGDILLNVNGVDLTGVTRSEAVANLKNTSSPVVLKVLEMRPPEDNLQDCALPPCLTPSPTDSIKSPVPNDDYSPLWVSWLQLPRWEPAANPLYINVYSIFEPRLKKKNKKNTDLFHLVPAEVLTEQGREGYF